MRSLLVVAAFSLFLACGKDREIGLSNQPISAQMRAVSIRVQHTSVNIGDRVDVMLPDSTVVLGNVEVSNLARVDSHVDIALFIVPPEDAERLVAVSKPSGFRLRSTSIN